MVINDSAPRMWGYRLRLVVRIATSQFIPTDVGLPQSSLGPGFLTAIHPHGCGATLTKGNKCSSHSDSSPRMWGYQVELALREQDHRFIPTDVGLPSWIICRKIRHPIHPHGCGATSLGFPPWLPSSDSSPRMWGYHNLTH